LGSIKVSVGLIDKQQTLKAKIQINNKISQRSWLESVADIWLIQINLFERLGECT
jgi:hypothetical protein